MKTIRSKMIVLLLTVIFMTTLALSTVSVLQLRAQLLGAVQTSTAITLDSYGIRIQEWIKTRRSALEALVPVALQHDSASYFQRVVDGLGLELVYAGHADRRSVFAPPQDMPAGYDPTSRPWYQEAVRQQGTILTAPYHDASTGELVVSFATPVRASGQIAAVVAADVSIGGIVSSVLAIDLKDEGHAILVGEDGTLIAHPDTTLAGKPLRSIAPTLAAAMTQQPSRIDALLPTEVSGREIYAVWKRIDDTPWTLALLIEADAIKQPVYKLLRESLLVVLAVGLLAGIGSLLLLRKALGRLNGISLAMGTIASGGGDLTRRLDISGDDEIGATAAAFNAFMGGLRDTMAHLNAGTAELVRGVRHLSDHVSRIAADSQTLSDSSSQYASGIGAITASIAQISETTQDVGQLAERTGRLAVQTTAEMTDIGTEINASAEQVRAMANTVERLAEHSNAIESIVGVIREIADQTNLLALNAAIEAARAGEQGRGFAVVADEVRKLAERTSNSTQQISDQLRTIRLETGAAVGHMQTTVGSVESSVARSRQAVQLVDDIRAHIDSVAQRMKDVAAATAEQRSATERLALNTATINGSVHETDKAIQGARETLQALASTASRTDTLLQGFQT